MNTILRYAFFLLVVRPLVYLGLGVNIRRPELLAATGPAILVANHNSHLDTLVLMSLFPIRQLRLLRPVAAADYFLRPGLMAWFSTRIIGIIPIARTGGGKDPLAPIEDALDAGQIVILFPEGTRGKPEHMAEFKSGVAHLARRCPDIPVVPVFLHGAGKSLPRGAWLPVPFFCDVFVGEPVAWEGDRDRYMDELRDRMESLADEGYRSEWS